jgi:hypothetical protein
VAGLKKYAINFRGFGLPVAGGFLSAFHPPSQMADV